MNQKLVNKYAGKLNSLLNSERFAEVARLHSNAFAWKPQNRIPLGIHVADPKHTTALTYEDWLNPEPFLEAQVDFLYDTLEVGSDLLPVVAINHLGNTLIPSMFGAELYMPDTTSASLQDVGPASLPVFSDLQDVIDIAMPSMDAGILPQVEQMTMYYRQHIPQWVQVVGAMPSGTFSTAMELRGSDLLVDLLETPKVCERLTLICADMEAKINRRCCEITGTALDSYPTNFGIMGTGLRLGEDSICNLSPEMIKQICSSAFQRINDICGGKGHIYFCSLAHSRFEHIYPALAEMPEVAVASSQFGFEYYQNHLDDLRNQLAVESFYGDAYPYICEKYGSFKRWAENFVPRFKNESGLVLYTQVSSIEEGKKIWATWEQAHHT